MLIYRYGYGRNERLLPIMRDYGLWKVMTLKQLNLVKSRATKTNERNGTGTVSYNSKLNIIGKVEGIRYKI